VPGERIELPTNGLQNRCSTAELTRLLSENAYVSEAFTSMTVFLLHRTYRETTDRCGTKGGTEWHSFVRVCSRLPRTILGGLLLVSGDVLQVAFGHLDAAVTKALLQAVDGLPGS
jgi:hypothetical protein